MSSLDQHQHLSSMHHQLHFCCPSSIRITISISACTDAVASATDSTYNEAQPPAKPQDWLAARQHAASRVGLGSCHLHFHMWSSIEHLTEPNSKTRSFPLCTYIHTIHSSLHYLDLTQLQIERPGYPYLSQTSIEECIHNRVYPLVVFMGPYSRFTDN